MAWGDRIPDDAAYRRAGARRRLNAQRQQDALVRAGAAVQLAQEWAGRPGVNAQIAQVLGISGRTVRRDLQTDRQLQEALRLPPVVEQLIGPPDSVWLTALLDTAAAAVDRADAREGADAGAAWGSSTCGDRAGEPGETGAVPVDAQRRGVWARMLEVLERGTAAQRAALVAICQAELARRQQRRAERADEGTAERVGGAAEPVRSSSNGNGHRGSHWYQIDGRGDRDRTWAAEPPLGVVVADRSISHTGDAA